MNKELVNFWTKNGRDCEGRTLDNILTYSFDELENSHAFIQWLFPTNRPSNYNSRAPLLDVETITALSNSVVFHRNYQLAICNIFDFWMIPYIRLEDQPTALPIKDDIVQVGADWMTPRNHNLLRMSRVMESCHMLGYSLTARSLFECLLGLAKTNRGSFISTSNIVTWYERAYRRDV